MYRYDEFDARFVSERVEQFAGQVQRRLDGELTEDEFKPLAADERALSAASRLYAARGGALWHAGVTADAQAGAYRAQIRQGLWPFHHAPEHPVQLAAAGGRARHPARAGRGRDACHPDHPAIASAMSPPIISPARWPARSRTRASWPKSSANGRACIPNSPSCRASSRSRCRARKHDRAAVKYHDIGIEIVKNDAGEIGYRVYAGGGMGRTPYVGAGDVRLRRAKKTSWPISKRSCASTTSPAGATTSTRRASRSWSMRWASRKCARRWRANSKRSRRADICSCRRRNWRASAPISPRPLRGAAATARRRSKPRARRTRISTPGAGTIWRRIARPAMPSPRFR